MRQWLKRRRAIMLAHNYQPGPIQDVADLVGDSLELSMAAAKTEAEVIVFCGVHFMAETAAILCPDKTVLLPRTDVGCCLAESVKVGPTEGPERGTARGAGGHLCQFHRRGQGRKRHLLHLRQCRPGRQFFDGQPRPDGAGSESGPLRGPAHPQERGNHHLGRLVQRP